MGVSPFIPTFIAKLIPTPASHMIAPLLSFHNKHALVTSSKIKILFENVSLIIVAFSPMLFHHTLQTVLGSTDDAHDWLLVRDDVALTTLVRTKTFVFIFTDLMVDEDFVVFLSLFDCEFLQN